MTMLADLTNLKTILRVKQMGRPFEAFEDACVPGGEIRMDVFQRAYRVRKYAAGAEGNFLWCPL